MIRVVDVVQHYGVSTVLKSALLPFTIDPRIVVSAAITMAFLVTLNVGPSLQSWRLTGEHWIVPRFTRQTSVEL